MTDPPRRPDEQPIQGGVNVVLQEHVARVMRERGWTQNGAQIATGIPASTIGRLQKGLNVSLKTILHFGEAAGESRERWTKIAGGVDPDGVHGDTAGSPPDPLLDIPADLLQYIRDPDVAELVRYYAGVPQAQRSAAKQAFKGLTQGLAGGQPEHAGDVVRRQREARTIGKRSDREDNPSRGPDGSSG